MTSKMSLFKKGLFISDIKRFWWLGALYTIALFFIMPFHHLLQASPEIEEWRKRSLQESLDLFSGSSELNILLIFIVPVILAVLIFRYMHVSRSSAMMHSLPCSRKLLFLTHNAAGLLLLSVPIVFTGLLLTLFRGLTILKDFYAFSDILQWVGLSLLFNTLFYVSTVFVAMFTGNSIANIVFTYILHILPVGLYILFSENIEHLVYGYSGERSSAWLMDTFPIFVLSTSRPPDPSFPTELVTGYLLTIVLLFVVALYAYTKRDLEAAGDIVAFKMIRPIFKYGVTACCTLLGGAYFANAYNSSLPVMVFAYMISSLLGYFIAEALLQKSVRVWPAYKGYLAYAGIFLLMFLGVTMDITGYVHRVPEAQDVQKAYFGHNIQHSIEMKETSQDSDIINPKYIEAIYSNVYVFESIENIENVLLLHDALLQKPHPTSGATHEIAYQLKDGSYLIRKYILDDKTSNTFMKSLYESLEYKQQRFPVLIQTPENIKLIECRDHRIGKKPLILSSDSDKKEFMQRLRKDVMDTSYEDLINIDYEARSFIIQDIDGKSIDYALRQNYTSVIQWMKDKGYYEKVFITAEDIGQVELSKFPPKDTQQMVDPKTVIVRDVDVLEELLDAYQPHSYGLPWGHIRVAFFEKGNSTHPLFEGYLDTSTPVGEKLKNSLQQLD